MVLCPADHIVLDELILFVTFSEPVLGLILVHPCCLLNNLNFSIPSIPLNNKLRQQILLINTEPLGLQLPIPLQLNNLPLQPFDLVLELIHLLLFLLHLRLILLNLDQLFL